MSRRALAQRKSPSGLAAKVPTRVGQLGVARAPETTQPMYVCNFCDNKFSFDALTQDAGAVMKMAEEGFYRCPHRCCNGELEEVDAS